MAGESLAIDGRNPVYYRYVARNEYMYCRANLIHFYFSNNIWDHEVHVDYKTPQGGWTAATVYKASSSHWYTFDYEETPLFRFMFSYAWPLYYCDVYKYSVKRTSAKGKKLYKYSNSFSYYEELIGGARTGSTLYASDSISTGFWG